MIKHCAVLQWGTSSQDRKAHMPLERALIDRRTNEPWGCIGHILLVKWLHTISVDEIMKERKLLWRLNITIELSIYNAERRRQRLCFCQREKTKEWSQEFFLSLCISFHIVNLKQQEIHCDPQPFTVHIHTFTLTHKQTQPSQSLLFLQHAHRSISPMTLSSLSSWMRWMAKCKSLKSLSHNHLLCCLLWLSQATDFH